MSLQKTRRDHGDTFYDDEQPPKKYWIIERELYPPNKAQLRTAVRAKDYRHQPRRFFLNRYTVWGTVAVILFLIAIIRSL